MKAWMTSSDHFMSTWKVLLNIWPIIIHVWENLNLVWCFITKHGWKSCCCLSIVPGHCDIFVGRVERERAMHRGGEAPSPTGGGAAEGARLQEETPGKRANLWRGLLCWRRPLQMQFRPWSTHHVGVTEWRSDRSVRRADELSSQQTEGGVAWPASWRTVTVTVGAGPGPLCEINSLSTVLPSSEPGTSRGELSASNTGWPVRLITRFCWHEIESCVLV